MSPPAPGGILQMNHLGAQQTMPVATVDDFLSVLQRSRLLSAEQWDAARRFAAGPDCSAPAKLAEWLVARQWVTLWQAQRLLAGNSRFFLGSYRFLEQIGEGAMGAVFKAQHTLMGRIVAIKVLSKARLAHPNALARFYREVQAVAALDHPNIVRAYDAGKAGNTHYLVMEYIEGADLNRWLKRHGKLPIPWACEFARQAALGLHHAHRHGMVHRDIKPANILVSWKREDDQPLAKILDLGLARLFAGDDGSEDRKTVDDRWLLADAATDATRLEAHLTREGTIVGTPDYLAPEQILNDHAIDARTDIFSLGCTLFRLLTGKLPYPGRNLLEKLQARINRQPIGLRSLLPEADEHLERVVARMLQTKPRDRFQTAAEVAQELDAYARPFAERWETAAAEGSDKRSSSSWELGTAPEPLPPLDTGLNEFLNQLSETVESRGEQAAGPVVGSGVSVASSAPSRATSHDALVLAALGRDAASSSSDTSWSNLLLRGGTRARRQQRRLWFALAGAALVLALAIILIVLLSRWWGRPSVAWPGESAGLVFAWADASTSGEIISAVGKRSPCDLTAEGDASVALNRYLQLAGQGGFVSDPAGEAFVQACRQTNEFTLELVVLPQVFDFTRPAVVLACGSPGQTANVRLAQLGDTLYIALRASRSDPAAAQKGRQIVALTPQRAHHLLLTYRPGEFVGYLDGRPVVRDTTSYAGTLENWLSGPLCIGRDTDGRSPWVGALEGIALRSRFTTPQQAQQLYELSQHRRRLAAQ
jgi:serine/threonine protein kinase